MAVFKDKPPSSQLLWFVQPQSVTHGICVVVVDQFPPNCYKYKRFSSYATEHALKRGVLQLKRHLSYIRSRQSRLSRLLVIELGDTSHRKVRPSCPSLSFSFHPSSSSSTQLAPPIDNGEQTAWRSPQGSHCARCSKAHPLVSRSRGLAWNCAHREAIVRPGIDHEWWLFAVRRYVRLVTWGLLAAWLRDVCVCVPGWVGLLRNVMHGSSPGLFTCACLRAMHAAADIEPPRFFRFPEREGLQWVGYQ